MNMVYGAPTCLLNHVENEKKHGIWGYPILRQAIKICLKQFLVVALLVCHGKARKLQRFLERVEMAAELSIDSSFGEVMMYPEEPKTFFGVGWF